jgi:hypothetical protein
MNFNSISKAERKLKTTNGTEATSNASISSTSDAMVILPLVFLVRLGNDNTCTPYIVTCRPVARKGNNKKVKLSL